VVRIKTSRSATVVEYNLASSAADFNQVIPSPFESAYRASTDYGYERARSG